jgi:hypothetical protein
MSLEQILKFSMLTLLLATSGSAQTNDEKSIAIDCTCQSKPNPSECRIKTVPFQELNWSQKAFKKPGEALDDAALALFCQRKANEGCQCIDDPKYFKGSIRP